MSYIIRTAKTLNLMLILLSISALAQESKNAETHVNQGEEYLQSNKYIEAIKEFKQAINIRPKWAEAYFKLGVAYSAIPVADGNNGDIFKAALKAFEEAVRLKPDWAEAHHELGIKYSTFQRSDEAIRSLKEAIRLKPDFSEAHQSLAIAYLYKARYKEAIDCLQEAIRFKPDRPLPHKLLGLAYLLTDDRERALQQHKILESLDQETANYLNNAIQSPHKPAFGVTSGRPISTPKPEYPAAAKREGLSGSVSVEVTVDEEGKVISARAMNGPPGLHGAAEAAALKARFAPTKLSGKPVTVKGVITYNFVRQ